MVKITANINNLNKFINWKPKFNKLSLIVKSSLKWEKNI
jgi:UDP-glucose 4-epimerase